MMRSMFSGVSGLRTHQERMDVIGDNIANVNTIGFKGSTVNFAEMMSQTLEPSQAPTDDRGGTNPQQIGLGVDVASIDTDVTQGSLESTGVSTDLAVDGDGHFIVNDGAQEFYTRAGNFDVDENGDLVSSTNGFTVQGWEADNNGDIPERTEPNMGDLAIPLDDEMEGDATTEASFSGNLDARASEADDTGEISRTVTMDVFDSQGDSHPVEFDFARTYTNDEITFEGELGSDLDLNEPQEVKIEAVNARGESHNEEIEFERLHSYFGEFTVTVDDEDVDDEDVDVRLDQVSEEIKSFEIVNNEPDENEYEDIYDVDNNGDIIAVAYNEEDTDDKELKVYLEEDTDVEASDINSALNDALDPDDEFAVNRNENAEYEEVLVTDDDEFSADASDWAVEDVSGETESFWSAQINNDIQFYDGGDDRDLPERIYLRENEDGVDELFDGYEWTGETFDIDNYEIEDLHVHWDDIDHEELEIPTDNFADLEFTGEEFDVSSDTDSNIQDNVWEIRDIEPEYNDIELDETGIGDDNLYTHFNKDGGFRGLTFDHPQNYDKTEYDEDDYTEIADFEWSQDNVDPGADDLNVEIDFTGLTQAAADYNVEGSAEDGYEYGFFDSFEIDGTGIITGSYTNGLTRDLGQVALANFNNPAGLNKEGDNLMSTSQNSGDAQIGHAGAAGFGDIAPGTLEMSNVDLAEEFTDMIRTQRGFQGNSSTIDTSDEMLQELVNLAR